MTLLLPKRGVRIAATGSYLPDRRVTSAELAARPGAPLTEAEIAKLTGVEERRWAAPEQATSDLAIAAGSQILGRSGRSSADRLLLSTTSPDYPSPASACLVQRGLSLAPAAACDISAACAGFLFALDAGARAVLTGDERALVLAADIRSRYVNPEDRGTAALFGDGAGGALLEPGPPGEGLVAIYLAADGAGAEAIHIPAGGSRKPASEASVRAGEHYLHMEEGPRVFLTALEGMVEAAEALLAEVEMSTADIDLVVPHQPNRMILARLSRAMRIPREKLFENVHRTGNMSSASVAVAFDEALAEGRVGPGAHVLLLGGGAGFCVGAALVRIPES